jgi:hypothetical protein
MKKIEFDLKLDLNSIYSDFESKEKQNLEASQVYFVEK